jgi:hypothetical protein
MIGGGAALFLLTPLLAVAAGVFAFRHDDLEALAVLALAGLPVLLLFDPLVSTMLLRYSYYFTARIASILRFAPYIGVAWALSRPPSRQRTVLLVVAALVLVAALVDAPQYLEAVTMSRKADVRLGERYSVPVSRPVDERDVWGRPALEHIREIAGSRYPVIASDTESSYYLPGLLPVAVVSTKWSHMPFNIPQAEANARTADATAIMDPNVGESQRRAALERWHAQYLLVTPRTPKAPLLLPVLASEADLLRPVLRTKQLALYEVVR